MRIDQGSDIICPTRDQTLKSKSILQSRARSTSNYVASKEYYYYLDILRLRFSGFSSQLILHPHHIVHHVTSLTSGVQKTREGGCHQHSASTESHAPVLKAPVNLVVRRFTGRRRTPSRAPCSSCRCSSCGQTGCRCCLLISLVSS